MAKNFKNHGDRIKLYAADARTAGHLVADCVTENTSRRMAGIALANAKAGDHYWVAISGVYNIALPGEIEAGRELFYMNNGWHGPYASNDVELTTDHQDHIPFGKTLSDPVYDAITDRYYADVLMYPPIYPYANAIGDDNT
jgi:predicted RecA/RadA family phage recombinase